MGNRQVFAQIGVFALLGLNVGAYYVFWPHKESGAQSEIQPIAQPKEKTQLLPVKADAPAPAILVPAKEMPDPDVVAPPLQIVNPPVNPPAKNDDEAAIRKLLDRIQRDAPPTQLTSSSKAEPPEDPQANVVRPMNADVANSEPKQTDNNVGVTSALSPRMPPSPWLLSMEMVGEQTQLIARLKQPVVNQRPVVEFKILCNRVEMKSPGMVQAMGNVTVIGGGLKGNCQRLTLPLNEMQLVFEEQAKIVQDGHAASTLKGERIVWEFNPAAEVQTVTPTDARPFNLFPLAPPSLGQPN